LYWLNQSGRYEMCVNAGSGMNIVETVLLICGVVASAVTVVAIAIIIYASAR